MKKWIEKLYHNDMVRYIFFGVCTTVVNLVVFYVLRRLGMLLTPANFISIVTAIIFAYVVNSIFVFHDKCTCLKDHVRPFCKFVSARLLTMVVEIGGVWFIVEIMGLDDMIGKLCTQVIVTVLNYIFSKFFVFTTGK